MLSPITVLELVAQIAQHSNEALAAIHALNAWADTGHVDLLGWSEPFVAYWVFGEETPDQISQGLKRVLEVCYRSDQAHDTLRDDARAVANVLEDAKRRKAVLLEKAVSEIRQTVPDRTEEGIRAAAHSAIANGIRCQTGIFNEVSDDEIAGRLRGYFTHHIDILSGAVRNENFNFFSRNHLNDHFDAQQLVFMADPSLHFFTGDTGYRRTAQVEPRIQVLEAAQMRDTEVAHRVLTAQIRAAEAA